VYVADMRKTYLKKLNSDIAKHGKGGLKCVSGKIGISYYQLYRIIREISQGTIASWEKIFNYYNKPDK